MKVVEKFEVEYVVPETEEEKLEIARLIENDKGEEKKGKPNFSKMKIVEKRIKDDSGFWKK